MTNEIWQYVETLRSQIARLSEPQLMGFLKMTIDKLAEALQSLMTKYEALLDQQKEAEFAQKTNLRLQQQVTEQTVQIKELKEKLEREKSQLRTASQALNKSEAKWQSIMRHSYDMITILDANATTRYHSPSLEQILGYKPEERSGKHFADLVHPEDFDKVFNKLNEVLQEGGSCCSVEYRKKHKEGHWVYVESIITNLLDDNNVHGIVLTSRDITGRKEAEIFLQQSHKQISAVLESIGDGFMAFDKQWRFTYINKEAEYYMKKPNYELLGYNVWELFPEAKPIFYDRLQEAMTNNETIEFTEYYQPIDLWLTVRVYPSEEGISVYMQNISKIKKTENALQKTHQIIEGMIQSSPLPMVGIDAEAKVMQWNPAATKLFGWTEDEVIGIFLPTVPRDEKDAFMERLKLEFKGKKQDPKEVNRMRKDGSQVNVYVWTAPLYNTEGKIIGSLRIYSDIEIPFWVRYVRSTGTGKAI